MSWPDLTRITLVLCATYLICYDIVAYRACGPDATISRVCLSWAYEFPLLVLAFGILLGHVFCSQPR